MKKIDLKKLLLITAIVFLALGSLLIFKQLFPSFMNAIKSGAQMVLIPGFIALFISYLISPVSDLLEKRFKFNKNLAVITTIVIAILFLLALLLFIFVFLGSIINDLIINFWPSISELLHEYIPAGTINNFNDILKKVSEVLSTVDKGTIVSTVIKGLNLVVNSVSTAVNVIMMVILTPVFLFFIMKEKKHIFKSIAGVLPEKYADEFNIIGSRSDEVIEKFFKGRIFSMSIMAVIFTIIFYIFGLKKYAILFGILIAFLDIIPYLGPFVGISLPVVYCLSVVNSLYFGIWTPIILIIINFLLQFFQQNILQPKIIGKEIEIHPLVIFASMLFFGKLLGVVGLIAAVPICGIIKVVYAFYFKAEPQEEISNI